MFFDVVTRRVRVLRICVGVLRDVTMLAARPDLWVMSEPMTILRGEPRSVLAAQLRLGVQAMRSCPAPATAFRGVSFPNPFQEAPVRTSATTTQVASAAVLPGIDPRRRGSPDSPSDCRLPEASGLAQDNMIGQPVAPIPNLT
jgi:hypothetical protein